MNARAAIWCFKSLVMTLAISLTACGGGDNSDPTAPSPTISNLSYSPSAVIYQSGGGTATITGTVSFDDPADQLASIRITSSGGLDATTPVSGESSQTSGSLTGEFQVSTNAIGNYTFEIWVVDRNGNSSNHLGGSFDVVPNFGSNWTARPSMTAADLRRVAWSGSVYAAVGAAGTIVTSPDGSTWTPRTSGTTKSLYGITWTGAEFFAVGDQGTVLMSTDGVTWAALDTGRTDVTLLAVANGGTELVVVGGQGNGNGANPGSLSSLIMSTTDRVTWTERPTSMSNYAFYGVAWSGTTFAAVGNSFTGGSGDVVWTSTDGVTWSSQTVPTGQYALYDLTWSGSNFVAVGHGYGLQSPDGTHWYAFGQQVSGVDPSFGLFASGVAFCEGTYLAVGDAFGQIETSTDALAWTETVPTPGLGTLYGAACGNSQFIVVGLGGAIFSSP